MYCLFLFVIQSIYEKLIKCKFVRLKLSWLFCQKSILFCISALFIYILYLFKFYYCYLDLDFDFSVSAFSMLPTYCNNYIAI